MKGFLFDALRYQETLDPTRPAIFQTVSLETVWKIALGLLDCLNLGSQAPKTGSFALLLVPEPRFWAPSRISKQSLYTDGWISAELVRMGDTLPSFRSYDDFVACKRARSEDMRLENEGVIVGPADGKDLANPIGGGDGRQDPRRGHRRRLLCPRQCPPRPSLRDPASTVATRRPSTYWRES